MREIWQTKQRRILGPRCGKNDRQWMRYYLGVGGAGRGGEVEVVDGHHTGKKWNPHQVFNQMQRKLRYQQLHLVHR